MINSIAKGTKYYSRFTYLKYGDKKKLEYEIGDAEDDSKLSGQNHSNLLKSGFSNFAI